MEDLFQACKDGNVEVVRRESENDANLDVNQKDVHGMSLLAYAARHGHVDVVRELLQRGAEKDEVVEQGYGLSNGEIAALFDVPLQQVADGYMHNPSVDMHGGQQMPDGTISYVNGAGEPFVPSGYPVGPSFEGAQYARPFFPDNVQGVPPQHLPPNFQAGGMNMGMRRSNIASGHGRKESGTVNLPPPDVARLIPCKYFPNCRYGDKCVFAHPIALAGPPPPPPHGHPLSPSLSSPPPHMQPPMIYQHMPPGYPFAPYAGPQQFINPPPMGHPMQPYGLPPTFTPNVAPQPLQDAEGQNEDSQAQSAQLFDAQQGEGVVPEAVASELPAQTSTDEGAAANPSTESTVHVSEESTEDKSGEGAKDVSESEPVVTRSTHRRQSFNSFLHHHAIPFQPQSSSLLAESSTALNGIAPRNNLSNSKAARRTGAFATNGNGFTGKRSNNGGERPACMFFQAGRCKYGDECRFPHLLADGTDARPMQAQQRQMYSAQMDALNANTAAMAITAPSSNGTSGNSNAPASAPTGPQADKRAAAVAATTSQSQTGNAQYEHTNTSSQAQGQSANTSQSTNNNNGKGGNASASASKSNGSNNVVRSQPSKTSTQGNATNARNSTNGNKKNNSTQRQQRQQQQQPQQRIPTVNDFPALSPNLNGSSNATSPLPTPSVVNGAGPSTADTSVSSLPASPAANASGAPKANFSAILSAPAPVKAKEAELAVNGVGDVSHDSHESGAKALDESESSPAPIKTHAAAAAAGITANGTTVSMSTKSSAPPKVNGSATKAARGGNRDVKSAAPNSYKAAASTAPSSNNVNGADSAADDDFQLVNRSRSSHKRPTQQPSHDGNGKRGDGYTPQAKAVAA